MDAAPMRSYPGGMTARMNFRRLAALFIAGATLAWLTVPGGVLVALALAGGLTAAVVTMDVWAAYTPDDRVGRVLDRAPTPIRLAVGLVALSVFNYYLGVRHAGRAIGEASVQIAVLQAISVWHLYRGRRRSDASPGCYFAEDAPCQRPAPRTPATRASAAPFCSAGIQR
jgi:hypothetical protein